MGRWSQRAQGLRSFNKVLYVTDIDALVSIDLTTGKIIKKLEIPGAKLLNDIASIAMATCTFLTRSPARFTSSKMASPRLVRRNQGDASEWSFGSRQELVVASWGEELDPKTWGTKQPANLLDTT